MIFMPYPDLAKSAASLDNFRLCHQRLICQQILAVLSGKIDNHWKNHPAVLMWRGHTKVLKAYHDILIETWVGRGKKNSMKRLTKGNKILKKDMPWWFGKEKFHRSHRSVLMNKAPQYYRKEFGNDKGYNKGQYFWPETKTKSFIVLPD